jgi:hypothetical protein
MPLAWLGWAAGSLGSPGQLELGLVGLSGGDGGVVEVEEGVVVEVWWWCQARRPSRRAAARREAGGGGAMGWGWTWWCRWFLGWAGPPVVGGAGAGGRRVRGWL